MTIRFVKGVSGKPDVMTCIRADGTKTWEPSTVGVRHDLIHYAVETTLGYTQAFYGLVAAGRDIDSFGTRNGRKDFYPDEAIWAETIVGLLQWPSVSGGPALADDEFASILTQSCSQAGCPAPAVTPDQLARVHSLIGALHRQWNDVAAGGTMVLRFPKA